MKIVGAVESYLSACHAENHSPRTERSYKDVLNDFVSGVGNINIEDLTPETINAYMGGLSARPGKRGQFSSHSMAKYYAVIRSFVRWLYDRRFIRERITDFTSAPRVSGDLPKALTDEEVKRLLDHVSGDFRDLVIMELFLDTGLRLNEVCALDLKDVHVQGAWCRVYGKGRKEAIVPLGRKLCRDLSIYIHAHRKPTYQDEPALFINRFGHRLEREGLAILVRRALANIGIEGKHGAHTLRHTFATNFLRNGGSLEALRRILRHNDIKVTQRYIHLVMDDVIGQHHQASPLDHMRK